MRGRGGRGSRGCRKPTTTVSLFFEAQLPEGLGAEKRECTCKRALGVHTCPWVFLCVQLLEGLVGRGRGIFTTQCECAHTRICFLRKLPGGRACASAYRAATCGPCVGAVSPLGPGREALGILPLRSCQR